MATIKTNPGDMFAIPTHTATGTIGFVIARHIGFHYNEPLIEVFDKFYEAVPATRQQVDTTTRLFRPIMGCFYFGKFGDQKEKKWPILFQDENYHQDQSNYKDIQIGYPYSGATRFDLWQNGKMRSVGAKKVNSVEGATGWQPLHISMRAAHHLAGLIGPTDQYSLRNIYGTPPNDANAHVFDAAFYRDLDLARNDANVMHGIFSQWRDEVRKLRRKILRANKIAAG